MLGIWNKQTRYDNFFFLFPGKSLQKKWKNIRDSFLRELRRVKGAKSGAAAKRKSPYVYFQHLMFLKDTVEPNTTESNINDAENIVPPTPESVSQGQPRSKKKKEDNNFEKEDLVLVLKESINSRSQRESALEDDDDRLFMLSLVKDFKKIPESAKLKTKMEMINLIHRAQSGIYDQNHYEPMTRHSLSQPTYPRSSYTNHQEYQQGYFTKQSDNGSLTTMSCRPSQSRPNELPPPLDSGGEENYIQSPESNYSQASQDSEIIETFFNNY